MLHNNSLRAASSTTLPARAPRVASVAVRSSICRAEKLDGFKKTVAGGVISLGAALSITLQANASVLADATLLQPIAEVADVPKVTPKPSDPTEQRKLMGEIVGSKDGPSADADREGDATIDNPNDSPRPKDRSKMGQPLASAS